MDIKKGYHLHIRGSIGKSFLLIVQDVPEASVELEESKVRLTLHKPRRELCMAQIGPPAALRKLFGIEDMDHDDDSFIVIEEYLESIEEVGKTLHGILLLHIGSGNDTLDANGRVQATLNELLTNIEAEEASLAVRDRAAASVEG